MACDVAIHEPYRACMGLYWPKNQRNPKCQNIDELRTAILQEWQQFPQERIKGLVLSMTRRVTELHNKRVDIPIIDLYALHIRAIDAFKSS